MTLLNLEMWAWTSFSLIYTTGSNPHTTLRSFSHISYPFLQETLLLCLRATSGMSPLPTIPTASGHRSRTSAGLGHPIWIVVPTSTPAVPPLLPKEKPEKREPNRDPPLLSLSEKGWTRVQCGPGGLGPLPSNLCSRVPVIPPSPAECLLRPFSDGLPSPPLMTSFCKTHSLRCWFG